MIKIVNFFRDNGLQYINTNTVRKMLFDALPVIRGGRHENTQSFLITESETSIVIDLLSEWLRTREGVQYLYRLDLIRGGQSTNQIRRAFDNELPYTMYFFGMKLTGIRPQLLIDYIGREYGIPNLYAKYFTTFANGLYLIISKDTPILLKNRFETLQFSEFKNYNQFREANKVAGYTKYVLRNGNIYRRVLDFTEPFDMTVFEDWFRLHFIHERLKFLTGFPFKKSELLGVL